MTIIILLINIITIQPHTIAIAKLLTAIVMRLD